jgi:hypothetical protein
LHKPKRKQSHGKVGSSNRDIYRCLFVPFRWLWLQRQPLTKLETQYDFTVKAVADLKASQARVGMRTWTIIIFSILFVIMALVMLYFGGVL